VKLSFIHENTSDSEEIFKNMLSNPNEVVVKYQSRDVSDKYTTVSEQTRTDNMKPSDMTRFLPMRESVWNKFDYINYRSKSEGKYRKWMRFARTRPDQPLP